MLTACRRRLGHNVLVAVYQSKTDLRPERERERARASTKTSDEAARSFFFPSLAMTTFALVLPHKR
jgi:hypothetical protein